MILEFFNLEDFKESIPFTALGARTCYSSGDLDYLLNDPRVVSREERAKFLSKLGNYKHFSVFAHSFSYKDLNQIEEEKLNKFIEDELKNLPKHIKAKLIALKIASTKFKSHYNPKYPTVIGISLRHYLEELLEYSEDAYYKAFEKIADYDIPINPLGKKENVSLIGLIKDYDGYAVFYIDNVSRTMTHQLVRHTALNFSQRSQRYVKEDENYVVIPPSIEENKEALELFKNAEKIADETYKKLVYDFKIKREDARFILPHGKRTTIVVSAPLSWIWDFIEKRTEIGAQWEIRKVAFQMKELLQEHL